MPPLLAIVGRPNVGKSTLFNSLIGKRLAIIAKEAGTTRDRIYQDCVLNKLKVTLIDTGGLEYGKLEDIESNIQIQAEIAINEANLILFVIDSVQALTADDFAAVDILRKSGKPVLLIANKCDKKDFDLTFNVFELGFGEPIYISAIHKFGIDELKHEAESKLKSLGFEPEEENLLQEKHDIINLAFIGRPNVGKSSIVNRLIGQDKMLVSNIPGTTRDSIDTLIDRNNQKFNLIDTAGIRKRGKLGKGIEYFSVLRGLRAIQRSDITVLLIDGEEGLGKQDAHVSSYALDEKKGLIIVVNKWDLSEKGENEQQKFILKMKRSLSFLPWAPVVFTSAKTGKNINKILDLAIEIFKERQREINKEELNMYIKKITLKHIPTGINKKHPKLIKVEQIGISPPTFLFSARLASDIHFSYKRYLENKIRERYGFTGTPLKMIFKSE